jgi:hypothetical protein
MTASTGQQAYLGAGVLIVVGDSVISRVAVIVLLVVDQSCNIMTEQLGFLRWSDRQREHQSCIEFPLIADGRKIGGSG